jgi:hypothetical protein
MLIGGVLVLGCSVAATTSQGQGERQRPASHERRARGPGEKPPGIEYIYRAVFSPDGKRLLTQFTVESGARENPRSLALWDVEAPKCLWTIHKKQLDVRRCAFSPDGKQILVLGGDKLLALDLQGQVSRTLLEDGRDIGCLAVTPDGKSLFLGRSKGVITVLTLPGGQVAHTLQVEAGGVGKLLLAPDGRFLVSYYVTGAPSDDVMFRLWDLEKREVIHEFRSAQGYSPQSPCAFSPDGKRLAVGGHPGEDPPKGGLKLLELPACKPVQALPLRSDAIAFTPDGNRLLCALGPQFSGKPAFFLWDLRYEREVYRVNCPDPITTAITVSPDGRLVFTAEEGLQRVLKLWDGASGKLIRFLQGGDG